jgi:hypothetical protein
MSNQNTLNSLNRGKIKIQFLLMLLLKNLILTMMAKSRLEISHKPGLATV